MLSHIWLIAIKLVILRAELGGSIGLIDDLMSYAEEENLDGLTFAADIEKAFDSVDHNFIFASLEKYGFIPDFIQ